MDSSTTGSETGSVSLSDMDNQPNLATEIVSTKRKGPHRNNNDETDNSTILTNPHKRTKMDTSTLTATAFELAQPVDGSGTKQAEEEPGTERPPMIGVGMDEDQEDESGLMIDERLFQLSSSSPDEVHRRNGGSVEREDASPESDHSNNSDKFYSQIKAMEEGKVKEGLSTVTVPSSSVFKDFNSTLDMSPQTAGRTRELSVDGFLDDEDDSNNTADEAKPPQLVHVYVKLISPVTNQVILDTKNFKSDMETMLTFLKGHKVDVSHVDSGYAADISSGMPTSLTTMGGNESINESRRVAKSSLGSSIPRLSDASTISRPSVSSQVNMPKAKTPRGRGGSSGARIRGGRSTPMLSSTRISYDDENEKEETSSGTHTNKTTRTNETTADGSGLKREAGVKENSTYSSSHSMSNSASTTTSSFSIKVEPGTTRRKARGQIERNGIASRKSVDEFNDPAFVKSATLWGSIGNDAVVFARWRDKIYYSGRIDKRGQNDTWCIHYEDDMTDIASETHVLPIKILGIGTWTIYCPSDVFKPENAIIVGQRFRDDTLDDLEKTEYALISDVDGRVIVSNRKNLTLAENDARDMRKLWQVTMTPKAADVSVENIVAGKRDRSAKVEPTPSSQIRALVAILDSNSKTKSADMASITKRSTTEPSQTPTTSKKYRRGANTEKNRTNIKPYSEKEEESHEEDSLPYISETEFPPTPELPRKLSLDSDSNSGKDEEGENSSIFFGMHFFLTASVGGEGAAGTSTVVTYDKEDMRKMIETGGGSVLDGVGSEGRRRKKVFLISDNFARTVKYIYALAAGIPCLSFNWITESIRHQRVMEYEPFELKAGFSIESRVILPAHREKPLKGFQVFVTGATDELYKYWKPVLQAAGAIIPKRPHPKKGQTEPMVPSQTDVLVTDTTCPLGVWEYAKEHGIPVVKPEWLVQTIIAGKKVAFDGHEKYSVTEIPETNTPTSVN